MTLTFPIIGVLIYLSSGLLLAGILNGAKVQVKLWSKTVSYAILFILLYSGGFFS
tara:strand:- start:233 stop:397 length:165 start_codon:yes stop_codon:yes gene_type:complete